MPIPAKTKNFVILLGGPGVYKGCDPEHDQTWANYLVPIQVATKNRMLNKDPDEVIHWFVYEPAYKDRWKDDFTTPSVNPALTVNRKAKADRVISQGSSSYMDRIEKIGADLGVRVKKINTPDEFWAGLAAFPDNSISRVWYSGHAMETSLMLKLSHTGCEADAFPNDLITIKDIGVNFSLVKAKIIKRSGKVSKFLGCKTNDFARKWSSVFEVTTEGAKNKIDFGVTDRPSKFPNIINRLENSKIDTGWQSHTPHRLPAVTP